MADKSVQLKNIEFSAQPTTILLPTNATTVATRQGHFQLPLPDPVTKTLIVPSFQKTLVSIPQVVDAGYTATFDKTKVHITNDKTQQVAWQGNRNKITNMWELPLQNTDSTSQQTDNQDTNVTNHMCNASHTQKPVCIATTLQEHILFLHQACGSPVKDSWIHFQ